MHAATETPWRARMWDLLRELRLRSACFDIQIIDRILNAVVASCVTIHESIRLSYVTVCLMRPDHQMSSYREKKSMRKRCWSSKGRPHSNCGMAGIERPDGALRTAISPKPLQRSKDVLRLLKLSEEDFHNIPVSNRRVPGYVYRNRLIICTSWRLQTPCTRSG